MSALGPRLDALIDALVPPSVRAGPAEALRRGRLAVTFSMALVILFSLVAAGEWAAQNPTGVAFALFFVVLNFSSGIVYRLTGRVELTAHGVLALCLAAILMVTTVRGGGLNGATLALAQMPLFATLLLGIRAAVGWTAVSLVTGAAVAVLARASLIADHLPPQRRLLVDHVAIAIATVVLFGVGALYEHRKNRALRDIEVLAEQKRSAEVARLRALVDAQLAQAEGFAVHGRIAASAAHAINNPLSFVTYNLQFIAESLPPGAGELRSALEDSSAGVERIRRIVAEMRLADDELGVVSVRAAIDAALKIAESHTGELPRIRVTCEEVPRVVANEARLVQVILYLVSGPAETVGKAGGIDREITVKVHGAQDDVVVEVHDPGAAHTGARHLLAPSSSGPSGGAPGELGLAMCKNIVQSFGGTLASENEGGGNVVRLTLLSSRSSSRG
jgi:signal transduction histidine kinase